MITLNDVELALIARLESLPDVPRIAYPNRQFTPDGKTYLEFRNSPNDFIDSTGTGCCEYFNGIALITVVAPIDKFTLSANDLAQQIREQFPKALRINAGSGNVLINQPTAVSAGFAQDGVWRVPIRVFYTTER